MRISEEVYGMLLRFYPDGFLEGNRPALQQLFRDQLRDADSGAKRFHLWISTIVDLVRSVPMVHLDERTIFVTKRMTWIAYAFCVTAMVVLFRFESRTNDAGVVAPRT